MNVRVPPILGAITALSLPYVIYGMWAGQDRILRFFPDDAFYYLEPACNFARTGRVTFDGVHLTNGFHPLNFLLIAAFATVTTKPGLIMAAFLVGAALTLIGLGLMVRAVAGTLEHGLQIALLSMVSLPIVTGFVIVSSGMESALLVLLTACLVVLIDAARAERFASPRRNALLGLGLAAFVLARLDMVIVLIPFGVMIAYRAIVGSARARPTAITTATTTMATTTTRAMAAARMSLTMTLPIVLIPAVLLGLYGAVNLYFTGHLLPINAYVKSLWVGQTSTWTTSWVPSTRGTFAGVALVLLPLIGSVVTLASAWRMRSTVADSAVVLLNLGNLLFYGYLATNVTFVFRWYFAFPFACLALDIVWLSAALLRGRTPRPSFARRAPVWAGVSLCAAMALTGAYLWRVGSRETSTSYQLKRVSELVARHGGAEAVSAVQDAGVIGYFAPGRVINLDGLANDFDYVDNYLRPRHVREYLQREGVTHVLVRDGMLVNGEEVARGTYTLARSMMDPRLVFSKQDELFRYELPGQFTVYYFRFPASAATESPHDRREDPFPDPGVRP